MKLVRVQALKDHEWRAVPRKSGEIYHVDSEDIRFEALLAIGFAKVVDPAASPKSPAEDTRIPSPPARYARRDMRAKR